MDADNGSVDHLDGAIMTFGEGVHDGIPNPSRSPANEAVVTGGVRTEVIGQVAPWSSGSQDPKDAIEHTPVFHPRHAARLVRKERLMAVHSKSVEAEF